MQLDKNKATKSQTPDEVFQLARYLGISKDDVLGMKYSEFIEWIEYMSSHPPLERVVDIHLSRIETLLQGEEHTIDNLIWIRQEDKDILSEHQKQQQLLESLREFGNM